MHESGGREEFLRHIDVSRETLAMLDEFANLLQKWSPKINLVAKSTLSEVWTRHFLDSAQILRHARLKSGHWVDIGTGGGFPGLVVAILASDSSPGIQFTLVESDQRKSVFLQIVTQKLLLDITVISDRIERAEPLAADIVSARALAPLPTLLGYASRHLSPNGRALLMRGASYRREIDAALEFWTFQSDECPSITDGAAVILSLGDIRRV